MTLQPPLAGLVDDSVSERTRIVERLANFRREWQKTIEGQSLLTIQVPVGLFLSDIANLLELNLQERHAMLGSKLFDEVKCFMKEQVSIPSSN